jgi:hypothetical protein
MSDMSRKRNILCVGGTNIMCVGGKTYNRGGTNKLRAWGETYYEPREKHAVFRGITIHRKQVAEHPMFRRKATRPPQERL